MRKTELIQAADALLRQFDLKLGDWPDVYTYVDGKWRWGIVTDELYKALMDLHFALQEAKRGT